MRTHFIPVSAIFGAALLSCGGASEQPSNCTASDDPRKSAAVAAAPDESRTSAERIREIVGLFGERGFTGSVLVARDGKVIVECAAGSADLEGKIPNTAETLFEIASLTKQFTAAAILVLAQDGKVALDDPISKHLPGIPDDCKAITIEHLLRHTSGIPRTNSKGGGDDLAVVLPTFLEGGPRHPPGSSFEYWNQGYALLSEIIKRSSGKEYAEFCKERLFAPAGMKSSRFTGDAPPDGATVAIGRSGRGAPRSALEHPYGGEYGLQYRGMGGAVCSVRDLWRWDRALTGDTPLSASSRAALFKPGLGGYGLGWEVAQHPRGFLYQGHGGAVRGFNCEMTRYPTIDGAIIVLSNDDRQEAWRLRVAIEMVLLDEAPVTEKPGAENRDRAAGP